MFKALPGYFGGKQKLVGLIFKSVPRKARFLDAFMGAGSVSLYAKLRGNDVVANDYSFFSEVIGRAVIENNDVTLSKEDVQRALIYGFKHQTPLDPELDKEFSSMFVEKDQNIIKALITAARARVA
jgi:adenine-specific DNA methylase